MQIEDLWRLIMLPKEAVIEFQQIYEEIYKEKISFEEAEKQALRVFLAIKATYKPIKKEWTKGGEQT